MRELKRQLYSCYIGLYKSILLASVQLTIALESPWHYIKNAIKSYEWGEYLKDLDRHDKRCDRFYNAIIICQNNAKPVAPVPVPEPENSMGPGPRNSLHWAVAFGVLAQVVQFVQQKEYPINALTPKKWTAMHLAAEREDMKIIDVLLTADGIDLRIKNDAGRTPLHVAALKNKAKAVKHLLYRDKGLLGCLDNQGRTAFLLAASKGHVNVLKVMKTKGQNFSEVTKGHGWSALHHAADRGDLETVKFLLANGTNKRLKVKGGGRKGMTAREIAEAKAKPEIVAIL
ncbi:ankyrin repeat-containing domain protein [Phaeosphaeriaceae sp. PMI808]|nr:ankyrin repeat-containing domain protein [Phaeosphaeriaceae sp. PMI808]